MTSPRTQLLLLLVVCLVIILNAITLGPVVWILAFGVISFGFWYALKGTGLMGITVFLFAFCIVLVERFVSKTLAGRNRLGGFERLSLVPFQSLKGGCRVIEKSNGPSYQGEPGPPCPKCESPTVGRKSNKTSELYFGCKNKEGCNFKGCRSH